jgi:poly(hydroxyalkanoate) depolymerase family esterase
LASLEEFGSNPGALDAKLYIPDGLKPAAALVVVLHGCAQTAEGYDAGSGWSRLADEYGFVVLYPEQTRANNANHCFNWFQAADMERDHGEALSIRQMIQSTAVKHDIDEKRIFVTGLSAGGAMANVMLATYPEVFAGGAVIAGLPYGTANSVPQAFDRMRGQGMPSVLNLQSALRNASPHRGPWPTISVWHGANDGTVVDANARALLDQWRAVHEVSGSHGRVEKNSHYTYEAWVDASDRTVMESYSIPGMAHGTPIDAKSGFGRPAPFMLDVGVSSTEMIARSWGLLASFERRDRATDQHTAPSDEASPVPVGQLPISNVQKVIEDALRSAGLMR